MREGELFGSSEGGKASGWKKTAFDCPPPRAVATFYVAERVRVRAGRNILFSSDRVVHTPSLVGKDKR